MKAFVIVKNDQTIDMQFEIHKYEQFKFYKTQINANNYKT